MGRIINIWKRRGEARSQFPLGCTVKIVMPEAWLDGKIGEVIGYDLFGLDIDLGLHIHPEDVRTTAPMRNCVRL